MILLTIALVCAGILFLGAIVYLIRSTNEIPRKYRNMRRRKDDSIIVLTPSQWDEIFKR